jgi:hypothetical protein
MGQEKGFDQLATALEAEDFQRLPALHGSEGNDNLGQQIENQCRVDLHHNRILVAGAEVFYMESVFQVVEEQLHQPPLAIQVKDEQRRESRIKDVRDPETPDPFVQQTDQAQGMGDARFLGFR